MKSTIDAIIYARDLDGTGSAHICSREDEGAHEYHLFGHAPLPVPGPQPLSLHFHLTEEHELELSQAGQLLKAKAVPSKVVESSEQPVAFGFYEDKFPQFTRVSEATSEVMEPVTADQLIDVANALSKTLESEDDGKPCPTDLFLEHLFRDHDRDFDNVFFVMTMRLWLEGSWDAAIEELQPSIRNELLAAAGG